MTQLLKEVALEGFEPSQAEPESDVLPLHHKAIQNVNFSAARLPYLFYVCKGTTFFCTGKFFG